MNDSTNIRIMQYHVFCHHCPLCRLPFLLNDIIACRSLTTPGGQEGELQYVERTKHMWLEGFGDDGERGYHASIVWRRSRVQFPARPYTLVVCVLFADLHFRLLDSHPIICDCINILPTLQ